MILLLVDVVAEASIAGDRTPSSTGSDFTVLTTRGFGSAVLAGTSFANAFTGAGASG